MNSVKDMRVEVNQRIVLLVIVLFFSGIKTYAQQYTITANAQNFCAGNTYAFQTNAPNNALYYWEVSGGLSRTDGASTTIPFLEAGNYSLQLHYTFYDNNGNLVIEDVFASMGIYVSDKTSIPLSASQSSFCGTGNVQLSVTNVSGIPASVVNSFYWTSQPGNLYTGSGTTLQANGLARSTFFILNNNDQCYTASRIAVMVHRTLDKPEASIDKGYRKVLIYPAARVPEEYPELEDLSSQSFWQMGNSPTNLQGTSKDLPVTEYVVASSSGYYYIRSFVEPNCWTPASPGIQVTVNTTPPQAKINEIKWHGYNELFVDNSDIDYINKFAKYYFVSSADGTEMDRPFQEGRMVFEEKTYFIRGRDNETGTWGTAAAFAVTLRHDDGDLNWIHTKNFDGTTANTVLSESKNYFDQRGQALQSQSKSFHKAKVDGVDTEFPVVFASQPLKDKYERAVGGTLSAPILQNDFNYNAGFALTPEGKPLSYIDFDKPVPLNTSQKGTLGNYYSTQNQWNEPATPQAKRLFSRTDFYEDGTGEERKSAQPGDTHFIGSGKEVLKGTFPVGNSDLANERNELTDYLEKRAIVFGGAALKKIEGLQTVVRDENERYVVSISDKSGKVLMTARKGTKEFKSSVSSDKMAYFYVLGGSNTTTQSVTITGTSDYILENTITNTTVTKLTSALPHTYTLAAGFYRVLPATGVVKVSYANYFSDIAYQFYNDAGRLVVSVSPNGYEQWVAGANYNDIDKSTHEYNHQGWLLSMTEKDAGKTQYKYRKDGKIRFSQNAQQADNELKNLVGKGRFSYTHYDDLGRPVESGEYTGSTLTFASLNTSLEFANQADYSSDTKKDWVKTYYDFPVALPTPSLPAEFVQAYVRGAVSCTENANTKTWYSYDELGRVVWMAQKPMNFPFTFVTQYEYDFLGNVLTTSTKARDANGWRDAFYHHYTYDKNKRLQKVYTSLDGNKKTLQAEYIYYLHGPLKRVVLATNLQGIDFVYNIHGWLTQINHPDDANSSNPNLTKDPGKDDPAINGVRKDVFGMILEYYEHAMMPGTASSLDPNQFHKIPTLEGEKKVETAMLTSPIDLYKASLRQSMEALKNGNYNGSNKLTGAGGQ
jgi:hypothetical protein